MTKNRCPTFAELRSLYQVLPASKAHVVALPVARSAGGDPLHVLSYVERLGVETDTLDHLLAGINGLEGEEELSAFRCREGIAVSIASEDEWILFTE